MGESGSEREEVHSTRCDGAFSGATPLPALNPPSDELERKQLVFRINTIAKR
jgi:hypothetical protein